MSEDIKTNMSNLSYESMLQLILQNMSQLTGNTTSSCNILMKTCTLLQSLKKRASADVKIKQESKEEIIMQIDEINSILENSQETLFSSLSCLKSQLESYRFIYAKMKENRVIQGDISMSLNLVEKALSVKDK